MTPAAPNTTDAAGESAIMARLEALAAEVRALREAVAPLTEKAMVASQDEILSLHQVAEVFGVSLSTAGRWRKAGMPALARKTGRPGTVRFRHGDVLAWLQRHGRSKPR